METEKSSEDWIDHFDEKTLPATFWIYGRVYLDGVKQLATTFSIRGGYADVYDTASDNSSLIRKYGIVRFECDLNGGQ